jgi:hypothetical protein
MCANETNLLQISKMFQMKDAPNENANQQSRLEEEGDFNRGSFDKNL